MARLHAAPDSRSRRAGHHWCLAPRRRRPTAEAPAPPPAATPLADIQPDDLANPALYINRELSWLEFNRRVLAQASDATHPLLERVKFLAISATNLDEFFMVRVATLLKKFRAGIDDLSIDGLSTDDELDVIRERAGEQMAEQTRVWMDELRPQLAAEGIRFLDAADYTPAIDAWLTEYFETQVFPVLTPLAFDPGHPFPFISNLSMNLAVRVRHGGRIKFARVKVPGMLPRLVPLPAGLIDVTGHDLRVPRGRHPPQRARAVPRHAGRGRAPLPRHPRHRHGDPGGRGRRPARDRGPRAEAAALRRAVAAAGGSRHAAAGARHPDRQLRGRPGRGRAIERADGARRPVGASTRCTGRR